MSIIACYCFFSFNLFTFTVYIWKLPVRPPADLNEFLDLCRTYKFVVFKYLFYVLETFFSGIVSPIPAPNLQFHWPKWVAKLNPTDLIGQLPLRLGLATHEQLRTKSLLFLGSTLCSLDEMNPNGFLERSGHLQFWFLKRSDHPISWSLEHSENPSFVYQKFKKNLGVWSVKPQNRQNRFNRLLPIILKL